VEAIYAEEDLPQDQRVFTEFNAEQAKILPTISRMKPALPDADAWATVRQKRSEVGL
jgi:ferredoxin